MSIEALCQDTCVKQTASSAAGEMGGVTRSYTDGPSLLCFAQNMTQMELKKYDARGSQFGYQVYFPSDPVLTVNDRLKLTVQGGQTLSPPLYLRVLAASNEGRPGENLLWIATCSVESTRPES